MAQLGTNLAQGGPTWPQLGPTWPNLTSTSAQLRPNLAPTWPQPGPTWSSSCTWHTDDRTYKKPKKTDGFCRISGPRRALRRLQKAVRRPFGAHLELKLHLECGWTGPKAVQRVQRPFKGPSRAIQGAVQGAKKKPPPRQFGRIRSTWAKHLVRSGGGGLFPENLRHPRRSTIGKHRSLTLTYWQTRMWSNTTCGLLRQVCNRS